MPRKKRWVKHLHLIPASTWMPAAQMADILRPVTDIQSRELSNRLKGAVGAGAGIQSRVTTGHSREYSINNHESLMAYLLN